VAWDGVPRSAGRPERLWARPDACLFCRNHNLAQSAPRPLRSSPLDPRPSPGRPFRQPLRAQAVSTPCPAGPEGLWSHPPGPQKDPQLPIAPGSPVPRSSCPSRGHQRCRAALCARRSSPLSECPALGPRLRDPKLCLGDYGGARMQLRPLKLYFRDGLQWCTSVI
jgi:hypothetical protein